jgi:hypothetical protein
LIRTASRYLLLISILIGIAASVAWLSEGAFGILFALPALLLVVASPAVFAAEVAGGWREPWARALGTMLIAAIIASAFTILGTSLLWPGLAFALPLSLFLEWRRHRAH